MTPLLSLLLPVIVSAAAVFVLSMIVHMTPWHRRDYARLPDEDGVMRALQAFRIPPGDYAVPHPGTGEYMKSKEYDDKRAAGPVLFVTVLPSGPWRFGRMLGSWFLFTLLVSTCTALVAGTIVAPGGSVHAVFHHTAVITFLCHAMGAVPMSIWYERKWSTTLRNAVDALLYAVATGWLFSQMWPQG